MWYRTPSMILYVSDKNIVYRVWTSGLVLALDWAAEDIRQMCTRIDAPLEDWASVALRKING